MIESGFWLTSAGVTEPVIAGAVAGVSDVSAAACDVPALAVGG